MPHRRAPGLEGRGGGKLLRRSFPSLWLALLTTVVAADAHASITSIASGSWSAPATWSGGTVPTGADTVTIADGHTVTIDVAAVCAGLTVGQGTSGVLQFEATTARTLTVSGNVTIAAGGTLQSAATGTVTTHVLSLAGNLTNDGTLEFSTNGNAAGAGIIFTGASSNTFSGTGATTDIRTLTINKGFSSANVLELAPSNFTVQGSTTDAAASAFLTLTNGTLEVSGTFPGTHRTFATAGYSIPSTAGFWLDNPSYTVAGQSGSPTNSGLLRLTQGTFNVGTSPGDAMGASTSATFLIEGGTLNVASRLATANTVTYTQSGGTVNVTTVGNATSSGGGFDLSSGANVVNLSGGTIVLNKPSTAAVPVDYRVGAASGSITGGTLQIGNAGTPAGSNFRIAGFMANVVIDSTTTPKTATLFAGLPATNCLNLTIPGGTTLNLNGIRWVVSGSTCTNNGTLDGTLSGSGLYFFGSPNGLQDLGRFASVADAAPGDDAPLSGRLKLEEPAGARAAQSYTGAGTVTPPLGALELDNPAGLMIDPASAVIVAGRVNLFRGTLINSNRITLGNGGTTAATTQLGGIGLLVAGGSFDQPPTFNYGTGGYVLIYSQEGVGRTTGFEIPPSRIVNLVFLANTSGLTIAGGGITLTTGLSLAGGLINTSAGNVLTLANSLASPPLGTATSYVNGPLAIEFNVSSPTVRTYAIGKGAAFRPLLLRGVNTGGVLQTYTAEVFNSATGGTPLPPLAALDPARYWTLSNSANLNPSARVRITYGADDGVVAPSSARLAQSSAVAGSYASLGGTATATTVESTVDLTPGNDYFTLAQVAPHVITASAGAGGSINPGGAVLVPDGANQTFNVAPDACHVIEDVLVDSVSVGPVASYTFTGVTADHTILATFASIAHTLSVNVVGGGTVTKDPDQPAYPCGASVQLTPVASSGFAFTGWSGDATGADDPLTVVMNADKTITATFTDIATAVAESLLGEGRTLEIFPNPSKAGGTHVVFRAPATGSVEVSVVDVTGRLVRRLTSRASSSGFRTVTWDGRDESGRSVSAGTYFVRMTGASGMTTKRLVVLR
ncbi:MAG: FlgD immunoglobulin-like domain containing protein [bacterium]